jgi:acyl carrier protein
MSDINKTEKIIYDAIDDVNLQLPKDKQIEKSSDTVLLGDGGKLDSLLLVLLVVQIEQIASNEFGFSVSLANEQLMDQEGNPFQTIRSLADYIFELVKDKKNTDEQS